MNEIQNREKEVEKMMEFMHELYGRITIVKEDGSVLGTKEEISDYLFKNM